MNFLLDTCVISELIKPNPDKNLVAWVLSQDESCLYLSVLTIGEIYKGIAKLQTKEKKSKLIKWVESDLFIRFYKRILPVDEKVAKNWGELEGELESQGIKMPTIDGLLAATAFCYNMSFVTRNISDIKTNKIKLINPWL